MGIYIGCDVGTVSVKAAVVAEKRSGPVDAGGALKKLGHQSRALDDVEIFVAPYRRIQGNPLDVAIALIRDITESVPREQIRGLCLTGSGGKLVAEYLSSGIENEFKSASRGVGLLHPDVSYIFEMGGENSKFLNINVF